MGAENAIRGQIDQGVGLQSNKGIRESLTCPVCLEACAALRCLHTYIYENTGQKYELYNCPICGLEFWHPRAMSPDLYQEGQFWGSTLMHLGLAELPRYTENFFEQFPLRGGTLLDVGCGDGLFIQKAASFGFKVWGIDFDENCVQTVKQRHGIQNASAMSLNEFVAFAYERDLKFDVVTMFEVLEHQSLPRAFLKQVRGLLKENGWVAGTVPNRLGAFNNFDRSYYFDSVLPPHHFLWFHEQSLLEILTRSGFKNVTIAPSHYMTLDEISTVLQARLFGGCMEMVKAFIKARYLTLRSIEGSQPGDSVGRIVVMRYRILQCIRKLVNMLFYPFAAMHLSFYNKQPQGLYFQARASSLLSAGKRCVG